MFRINLSIICLSLRYLTGKKCIPFKKHTYKRCYEKVAHVSKWVFHELVRTRYSDSIFLSILERRLVKIAELLMPHVNDKKILNDGFYKYCNCVRLSQDDYSINLIKLFINNGADIHMKNNVIFKLASKHCDYDLIKLLINHESNLELSKRHQFVCVINNYAFKRAIDEQYFNIVKLLLENGADIHSENDYALKKATQQGCFKIVKLLIENGANIHFKNNLALKIAIKNRYFNIVELLLENGADIYFRNNYVLRMSKRKGYDKLVEILRHYSNRRSKISTDTTHAI